MGGKGGKAWDEDEWGVVKIGEEELVIVSMCGRCQVSEIQQGYLLTTLEEKKIDRFEFVRGLSSV